MKYINDDIHLFQIAAWGEGRCKEKGGLHKDKVENIPIFSKSKGLGQCCPI